MKERTSRWYFIIQWLYLYLPYAGIVGLDHGIKSFAHSNIEAIDRDRFDCWSICMRDLYVMASYCNPIGRCRPSIDEPKSHTLPFFDGDHRWRVGELPIDERPFVWWCAGHPTHHSSTLGFDSRGVSEVFIENERLFAVVVDVWVSFLDDEWTEKATIQLKVDVAVVPVGPCRCCIELVDELVAGAMGTCVTPGTPFIPLAPESAIPCQ